MRLAPLPKVKKKQLTEGMDPPAHISYQITVAANLMAFGSSVSNVKRFGVKTREWRVLGCLMQAGPATASDIVRLIQQDKGSVSRAITGLEREDLVGKIPNYAHKNSPYIWLTNKGRKLVDRIYPVFIEQAELFTDGLTDKEKRELCRLLDKLKNNVERVRLEQGI
ncbi:MarR family winged helix-turn-helix transcriptional regulator [Kineobactrum salinum]|uniref:Winged helix-turn-helix transcriptional regulator n=1 Tax=Kineobactrum salinum TaxID=2708301 RepID=A0A6C0TYI1_9GAMM|nr:MarR family winged helix-turn-helix transcriptional regulator [Kineobactrum salinum]QIB64593.1 winged helix-turn-helix transcriptional regulator [Kineobactrum salinum]